MQHQFLENLDFECMKKWEWSRNDFRALLENFPLVTGEFKSPYLLSASKKRQHSARGSIVIDEYVQCGSFRAFKESLYIVLTPGDEQLGPQPSMMKENPAPVAAYETGAEAVAVGREMGRDEGQYIQRDAINRSE